MRTRAIATALLVAALALAAAGCDQDDDGRTAGAEDAGRAAFGDVELTSCQVDDELSWPSATVRITNHTATTSNYVVQIAFDDGAGRQVTEGVAAASSSRPARTPSNTPRAPPTRTARSAAGSPTSPATPAPEDPHPRRAGGVVQEAV
ncbi:hypothetical protein ACFQ2M_08445 [Kitasatospora saccharophila]|uniref:hypothetical protein n=1 Tax=Kitasatospora saccharophila TaxID=407973 RepID=UPI003635B566